MFQINRRMPAGIVFAMAINSDVSGAFPKFGQFVERANQFLFASHDTDEALHHFLQISLHLVRVFGIAGCFVLATGGIGRAYRITSNSWEYTGDGQSLAYHAGAELIDMAELHAKEAPDRVRELEAWGAVFDRTADGRILQRNFGGHRYPRLAHVGDRTGLELILKLGVVDLTGVGFLGKFCCEFARA
jgi:succinate dehydrogenase/fumarate reductase flavoprotein subunit